MRELLQQARDALATCQTGGYVDVDRDWHQTWWHDEKLTAAAIAALDAALAAAPAQPDEPPSDMDYGNNMDITAQPDEREAFIALGEALKGKG